MADDAVIEEAREGRNTKRNVGLLGGMVKILTYIVAAIILIIVMVVTSFLVTKNLLKGNHNQQISESLRNTSFEIYNPIYTYYDQIEQIRTRSADQSPRSITLKIQLGYDADKYKNLSEELAKRNPQLTDMVRSYFSQRTAIELSSENEERIKEELKNMMNELLQNGRIDEIVFPEYQVLEL